jgi:two-component system C4-dicarboxylate transport response regulator DctD
MRNGAYDFLEKPFPADRLLAAAARAQDKRRLVLENRSLKSAWAQQANLPPLLGQSAPIERLRQLIASLGPANVDILITGQTGTGKEVVARHLHAASGRTGEFVALNCGALPEAIFESEIFGYEPGAFTSAQKRRIGKLEFANGGTLFLDEIESLPLTLQVKLLRVLQERKLERLGSNASIALDCRVIAASKVDLLELSAKGLFRDDLFYRIAGVSLDLPALAQRREDIPLLLSYFMQMATLRFQRPFTPLTPAQLTEIQWRHWRGNVRELRSFADRLVLGVADLQPADNLNAMPQGLSLPQQLDTFECQLIKDALAKSESVSTAAEYLGIPKKTLYDKLKKYQIGL